MEKLKFKEFNRICTTKKKKNITWNNIFRNVKVDL